METIHYQEMYTADKKEKDQLLAQYNIEFNKLNTLIEKRDATYPFSDTSDIQSAIDTQLRVVEAIKARLDKLSQSDEELENIALLHYVNQREKNEKPN